MRGKASNALILLLAVCMMATAVVAQRTSVRESKAEMIPAGALLIPMNVVSQGDALGMTTNMRAYDLVNHLVENNVPVKWATKAGEANGAHDLIATVARFSGKAGGGVESMAFSGGAFIVPAEYVNRSVGSLIASFNAAGSEVAVYRTAEPAAADIRHTLTRKAKAGPGSDTSGAADTSFGAGQTTVFGYKSVRRSNIRQGGPSVIAGDTLEWTIDFINNGPTPVTGFNIRDQIGAVDGELTGNLTFVAGSNIVTITSGGATATRNTAYDGIGDDSTSDMLASGATLPVGGRIQMKLQTTINMAPAGGGSYPDGQILYNQALGRGNQITGTVKTDAIDWTNTTIFGIDIPPQDSLLQLQDPNIFNATIARIKSPTRADASIAGEVRTAKGNPIANALVTVTNAATGEVRTARTNATGSFMVGELGVGDLYIVTVQHKRYVFDEDPTIFPLMDNVSGLAFIGVVGEGSN